jgi:hypothetical protein
MTGPRILPDTTDEASFQKWYRDWANRAGIDPDPDNPLHKYDYRAAFRARAEPKVDPGDGLYHWPSEFKADDHPNRYVDGVDTKTLDRSQKRRLPPDIIDLVKKSARQGGPATVTSGPIIPIGIPRETAIEIASRPGMTNRAILAAMARNKGDETFQREVDERRRKTAPSLRVLLRSLSR